MEKFKAGDISWVESGSYTWIGSTKEKPMNARDKARQCPHCKNVFANQLTLKNHLTRREVLGVCPVNQGGYQSKHKDYLSDLRAAGLVKGRGTYAKLIRTVDTEWT